MEDELKDYEPSGLAQKWFRESFGGKGIADPWPRLLMYAWDRGYTRGYFVGKFVGELVGFDLKEVENDW